MGSIQIVYKLYQHNRSHTCTTHTHTELTFHTVYDDICKSLLRPLPLSFFLFKSGVHDNRAATKAMAVPTMMTMKAQPSLQSPILYMPDLGPQSDVTCELFQPTGKTSIPAMYSKTEGDIGEKVKDDNINKMNAIHVVYVTMQYQ